MPRRTVFAIGSAGDDPFLPGPGSVPGPELLPAGELVARLPAFYRREGAAFLELARTALEAIAPCSPVPDPAGVPVVPSAAGPPAPEERGAAAMAGTARGLRRALAGPPREGIAGPPREGITGPPREGITQAGEPLVWQGVEAQEDGDPPSLVLRRS